MSIRYFNFQLEDFNEIEFRILCDHLGHSLPVHKRYYRLRDSTTELTKVAKMLMRADEHITQSEPMDVEEDEGDKDENTSKYLSIIRRVGGLSKANLLIVLQFIGYF